MIVIPKSFVQRFAQHGDDQQGHGAADEGGEQLGPAEGGGQGLEHGGLQGPGLQQGGGHDAADDLDHDQIQGGELAHGGEEPGGGLTGQVLALPVCQQMQQELKRLQQLVESDLIPAFIKEAAKFCASFAKRNAATVGGNLALRRDDSYLAAAFCAATAVFSSASDSVSALSGRFSLLPIVLSMTTVPPLCGLFATG